MRRSETTEGEGQARTTENVVRLPRDWLGPREELVPIGSRADALDRADKDTASPLPPAASSFWGEDSGSVQAAMQAPAGEWPTIPREPAAARRRRAPRFSARWLPTAPVAGRWGRVGLALGLIATCVIAVLAVIGLSEGPSSPADQRSAAIGTSPAASTPRGVHAVRSQALAPEVTEIRAEPRSRHVAHVRHRVAPPHGRSHGRRASATRHRLRVQPKAVSSPGTSGVAPATTPTTTSAPTTTPAPTAPVASSTGESAAPKSTAGSRRQPALGSAGTLAPGSSPDS
jgi:hypothetical protein